MLPFCLREESVIRDRPVSPEHALLIRQLTSIAHIEEGDLVALAGLPLRIKEIQENRDIIREGEKAVDCCVILDGLACRYKMVVGGRRQILSFHLPGDLPDLQGLHLSVMDHSVSTLTRCRVALISHESLLALTAARPGVAHILYRHALVDASIFREWIANLGRRNAYERIAHIFCELYARMQALDLTRGGEMILPLTQPELGDAAGLSTVHVNRILQSLRQDGLIESQGARTRIVDWNRLQQVADFDPLYLHLRDG